MPSHNFPNLIIIGVHKAGTTSLHKYLGEHSDVFASLRKELHYFTPLLSGGDLPPAGDYSANFDEAAGCEIRLESSPSYLYGKDTIINNIDRIIGDVKFIVVLRDPVQRFVSFYKQMISSMRIDKKETIDEFFSKSLKDYREETLITRTPYNRSIREGVYVDYLAPWLSLGKEKFHVVFFDQLRDSPHQLLVDVSRFLEIDGNFYENYFFGVENKSMQPKNILAHRFVYNFYMRYEVFFRKHGTIKNLFKNIYDTVNHKEFSRRPDGNVLESLSDIYSLPNKNLGKLLRNNGYDELPSWLN